MWADCIELTPGAVRWLSRADGSKLGRDGRGGRGGRDVGEEEVGMGGKERGCCCWMFDRVSAIRVRSVLKMCVRENGCIGKISLYIHTVQFVSPGAH